ncbi:hypothetical protein K7X08_004938 [Anisodus acutangulus]|uniref:Uncharacterized protein n=1 Tax=Anisodus acutangulus TaxID=402998 RepID=A0A9Q1MED9_9SOLA|nr:hypothetical protein K7X08_004938 [Anisodus acutangulus]
MSFQNQLERHKVVVDPVDKNDDQNVHIKRKYRSTSLESRVEFLEKTCDAKLDNILDNKKEKERMDRLIAALHKSGVK